MRSTVDSAVRRSSRRPWCSSGCCATRPVPETPPRCRSSNARRRPWRAAASTTSSPEGFARYSTDASWVVPHFEKMLYDNALLLRVYSHLWRQTDDPSVRALAQRVALETAEFLVRDLGTPEGGFASALDADSEGEEGRFYVWTPQQLIEALGQDDGEYAATLFGVTAEGTFEHGRSVLQLLQDPEDDERATRVRLQLLASRASRVAPARDDKVVAAWNGLAISALAEAGMLFGRQDLVRCRRCGAPSCWTACTSVDGRLLRTSRDGVAGRNAGVLEDYGDVAEGLLLLASATSERTVDRAGGFVARHRHRAFRRRRRGVLRHC